MKKNTRFTCIVVVVVLTSVMVACSGNTAAPTPGIGQDYYIDSGSGDDNNSGTSENSPWNT